MAELAELLDLADVAVVRSEGVLSDSIAPRSPKCAREFVCGLVTWVRAW